MKCNDQELQRRQNRSPGYELVTFQEVLRSVQALGGKFVVPKWPQQLADDDVGLLGRRPVPHVRGHHCHLISPLLETPVLQPVKVWVRSDVKLALYSSIFPTRMHRQHALLHFPIVPTPSMTWWATQKTLHSRDDSVGIFLHGVHLQLSVCRSGSTQRGVDQRTTTCPQNHQHPARHNQQTFKILSLCLIFFLYCILFQLVETPLPNLG